MYEYKGKSVFGGIAIGRIKVYSKEQQQVKRMHIDDCESEKQRYINAVDKAVEQLGMLYDKALKEVGEANAAIFEMHQIMLEDDDYKESVLNILIIRMLMLNMQLHRPRITFHQCLRLWTMNI